MSQSNSRFSKIPILSISVKPMTIAGQNRSEAGFSTILHIIESFGDNVHASSCSCCTGQTITLQDGECTTKNHSCVLLCTIMHNLCAVTQCCPRNEAIGKLQTPLTWRNMKLYRVCQKPCWHQIGIQMRCVGIGTGGRTCWSDSHPARWQAKLCQQHIETTRCDSLCYWTDKDGCWQEGPGHFLQFLCT